ncbi:hypothetical protein JOD02_002342 [Caldicoprobacter guelmensis]|uniref:hypothetical protein n=1 Tax=Caldicoprobacter guelmensis TaxID=1170224 RepID=UPI00195750F1|nr:hypothetical protein [Caldicoprobacter guelmensis]MBM7583460.1 hypothetical protein [Caldicoprobacter guelmensis]
MIAIDNFSAPTVSGVIIHLSSLPGSCIPSTLFGFITFTPFYIPPFHFRSVKNFYTKSALVADITDFLGIFFKYLPRVGGA